MVYNSFFPDGMKVVREVNMLKEQQQIPVTFEVNMDNTYISVQKDDHPNT